MRHSIISWDCTYRDFFHLVGALQAQDYARDAYELIFVEQRCPEAAQAFARSHGSRSLQDLARAGRYDYAFQVLYLSDPPTVPYHLGRALNHGLRHAKGEVVSIMDGDQLISPDFLHALDRFHEAHPSGVANVFRKNCRYPVGVRRFSDWRQAVVEFRRCHNACRERFRRIPHRVNNYAPMISARREHWESVEGFDESPLWATVLSKSGLDVNTRLEIATGNKSRPLPDVFTIHPWHPVGGGAQRAEGFAQEFFGLQNQLIQWSQQNQKPGLAERAKVAEELLRGNESLVREVLALGSGTDEDLESYSMMREIIKCKLAQARTLTGLGR